MSKFQVEYHTNDILHVLKYMPQQLKELKNYTKIQRRPHNGTS
jgi:hypothetical protein